MANVFIRNQKEAAAFISWVEKLSITKLTKGIKDNTFSLNAYILEGNNKIGNYTNSEIKYIKANSPITIETEKDKNPRYKKEREHRGKVEISQNPNKTKINKKPQKRNTNENHKLT